GFVAPGEVEPSLRAQIEAAGARLYVLPQKRPGPAYVRALAALVRRERYDILHAHGNSSSLFFEMLAAFLGGCRARVAHSHNTTCNHIRQDRRLRPFFYKSYTAAAACGRDAGQWLFEDRPFTVLPNAVDLPRFSFDPAARERARARLGIEESALVVGHVGRFNGQKNHRFLLEVFSRLLKARPDARLLLVGDGYLEAEVRQQAAPLGKRVMFTGSVPDPETYLAAMDVMALPSLFEGFPTVLLEWQCAGLPTLASAGVTREAALTPLISYLPLEAGAAAWAEALLSLPRPPRAQASREAAAALEQGGYALKDAAAALLDFYRTLSPSRKTRFTKG
ncbi:MAG TPA: glycosyltransferase, partial [Candidatus Pullichristensenella stercoripullorum]|nr:glycosyltransferase [Candidatus Pullichristensenella stercoripullorum]